MSRKTSGSAEAGRKKPEQPETIGAVEEQTEVPRQENSRPG